MAEDRYEGKPVGHNGVYFKGDTPASPKSVTGRYVIDPGKSPHPPHTHVEEEVMIVESGLGEIFCDGKTTKVGARLRHVHHPQPAPRNHQYGHNADGLLLRQVGRGHRPQALIVMPDRRGVRRRTVQSDPDRDLRR